MKGNKKSLIMIFLFLMASVAFGNINLPYDASLQNDSFRNMICKDSKENIVLKIENGHVKLLPGKEEQIFQNEGYSYLTDIGCEGAESCFLSGMANNIGGFDVRFVYSVNDASIQVTIGNMESWLYVPSEEYTLVDIACE